MKLLSVFLVIIASSVFVKSQGTSPSLFTPSVYGFNVQYDRLANTTSVSYSASLSTGIADLGGESFYVSSPRERHREVIFTVLGVIKGKNLKTSLPIVCVILSSQSEDWVYLKTVNTFRVVLDGKERLLMGEIKLGSGDVLRPGQGLVEQLALEVPFAMIERFSRATTFEIQIGTQEFELKPKQIEDLKKWVSRFPAAVERLNGPPQRIR